MEEVDYDVILNQAMDLIKKERPTASAQKKAAFANGVCYLVTGEYGSYGGPSVREHAVSYAYCHQRMSFKEAAKLLLDDNGLIFGPLLDIHRRCWREEYCFDDDPMDRVRLQKQEGDNCYENSRDPTVQEYAKALEGTGCRNDVLVDGVPIGEYIKFIG